jgi:2-polyprenyl-3-methyl-5-hydroxy-6-metoxy-1,4-benzoquinol methylase
VKTWSTPVRAGNSGTIPCACCGGFIFKPALNCEGFNFVRCKSCGLVQMNPQPVKNEIIARYNSEFADDYLSYELENEAAFLKLQQLALRDTGFDKLEKTLFSCCKTDEKPSALDVGCATGSLLESLCVRGWRVTGVEISSGAGYAQKTRNLDIKTVPLEECCFPSESFDAVLASHLIEHLNDPRSFLTETFRILKNNGRVFITTPNIGGFQARLFGGHWRSAIFDHLYLFSKKTLTKMLKEAGFKIESRRTWGGLAAGFAPSWIKKPADFFAKRLGCGDVMIIRARKTS